MDELQPPSQPKILIIRLSSIGDIVLTTPVVRAVNEQLPEAKVHFLVRKVHFLVRKDLVSVVENNPHIHKIHIYDPENVSQTIDELRQEQFTVVSFTVMGLPGFLSMKRLQARAISSCPP